MDKNNGKSKARKFRKRPEVIEAIQYDGNNLADIAAFVDGKGELRWDSVTRRLVIESAPRWDSSIQRFVIETLNGPHTAHPFDWIIKGKHGEFTPMRPDVFEETYIEVNQNEKATMVS